VLAQAPQALIGERLQAQFDARQVVAGGRQHHRLPWERWLCFSAAAAQHRSGELHPAARSTAARIAGGDQRSVADLAAAAGCAPSALSRRFAAACGCTLTAYRQRCRLDRVLAAMADGERNLLHATLAAGFGRYAQFHRVVRRELGRAPASLLRS
jgi:AraC-like DNA-binding protein